MINLTLNESALVYRYSGSTIVIAWEYHYPLIFYYFDQYLAISLLRPINTHMLANESWKMSS